MSLTNGVGYPTAGFVPKRAREEHEDQGNKVARGEDTKADSPLHSPVLSDEDMSLEPATVHAVKLQLHFLDSIGNPKKLQEWQWTLLTSLLQDAKIDRPIDNCRVLVLSSGPLKSFRINDRIHFARLTAFLQLIRNPDLKLCKKPMREWTHLDPSPFSPEERAEAIAREDLPLWRPALLSFVEGDVTIKSGRITAVGFRQILKGCKVFETILTAHPDEHTFQMNGIEPFLLATAQIWSYCKPYTAIMSRVKTEMRIPHLKNPAFFVKAAPEWLQEATDATWWQHFFSLLKPNEQLDCIPIAMKHNWPSIRCGCEQWANGQVDKLLAQLAAKPVKKAELETRLYKLARAVSQLNVTPDPHLSIDKIRTWCPHLVQLTLTLCEHMNNRNEKTFHFPQLTHLELRFLPQAQGPLFLDCLSGCPRLEKLKISAISFPKHICRCQPSLSKDPFLPELRTLELVNLDLGGPSDSSSQRLFSRISGMAKLEELCLRNIDGLTADDILMLSALDLKVLKIIFNRSEDFSEDIVKAVAELKNLAHVELDPLSDQLYDLFASLSADKR